MNCASWNAAAFGAQIALVGGVVVVEPAPPENEALPSFGPTNAPFAVPLDVTPLLMVPLYPLPDASTTVVAPEA